MWLLSYIEQIIFDSKCWCVTKRCEKVIHKHLEQQDRQNILKKISKQKLFGISPSSVYQIEDELIPKTLCYYRRTSIMANLSKHKLPSVSYFCFIFVIFQAFASIDLLEVVICLFSLFTYTKK